jgi:hypothetical protein
MSCEKLLERISINPAICFGKPAASCVPSSACLSDLCGGFGSPVALVGFVSAELQT